MRWAVTRVAADGPFVRRHRRLSNRSANCGEANSAPLSVRLSSMLLAFGIALTVVEIGLGSPLGLSLGTIVVGVGFGA
jgi:hypothetical protein